MNIIFALLLIFVVSAKACFFQNCYYKFNWQKRMKENGKRNDWMDKHLDSSSKETRLNFKQEFQQCFDWTKTSKQICSLVHTGFCCDITNSDQLICKDAGVSQMSFVQFICGSTKKKTEKFLRSFLEKDNNLIAGNRCCVDTSQCCEEGYCTPRITCSSRSIAHKTEKNLWDRLLDSSLNLDKK